MFKIYHELEPPHEGACSKKGEGEREREILFE